MREAGKLQKQKKNQLRIKTLSTEPGWPYFYQYKTKKKKITKVKKKSSIKLFEGKKKKSQMKNNIAFQTEYGT